MASRRFKSLASLFCTVLLLVGILQMGVHVKTARGQAQTTSPQAILDTVNALRASRGLKPYLMDAEIKAYAQAHSEYQAEIQTSTHQHRDGSIPPDLGLVENVAGGDLGYITPEFAVYQIWQDAVHMKTMVGFSSGVAGVGVANDGETEYYTLDVRPGGSVAPTKRGNPTATKIIPIVPLVTMTMRPNGCTSHLVGYGQSLWAIAIAYGVKVNDIRGLNGISMDSTDIYAGQKLLIRCVTLTPTSSPGPATDTPTGTPEFTETSLPATTTRLPTEIRAAAVTAIQERGTAVGPPPALIAGLLILSGGTLLVILAFSLMKRR